MIDPTLLRNELDLVVEKLVSRGENPDKEAFLAFENERRSLQVETQALQQSRNQLSKQIGISKSKGEDASGVMAQVKTLLEALDQKEHRLKEILSQQNDLILRWPNLPHESVPDGLTEEANQEIRQWGAPTEQNFEPKDHVELGHLVDGLDFEVAANMSGSRFAILKGPLARLHRALAQFMLQVQIEEHGYTECQVPYLVDEKALVGTGQLPNLAEDLFHLKGDRAMSLIPTAEVPLANLVRESILSEDVLPLKFVSLSPCFRSEAGSYGKDTKGLIRMHQFEKVELVQIVHPEHSYQALEELTQHAQTILERLKLPYRVMALCKGDMGFCAAKTYDLEVWLPAQNCYREISSCSNTESFQARRLHARFRPKDKGKPQLVHTLNGSGLAVGRTLVAVMENYQDPQGNIHIPSVLQPWMGGLDVIKVKN